MKPISRIRLASMQDRRRRRTGGVIEALHYQLDACRAEAQLDAIVVADSTGMCLASSGATATCDELAARLPLMSRKAGEYIGILRGAKGTVAVAMKRIMVGDSELYACALGGDRERHVAELHRAEMGVRRILMLAA